MKYTQKAIAKELGYSQAQISRVLSGVSPPSVKLAKQLEPYLGKPWQSWFEEPQPAPQKEAAE